MHPDAQRWNARYAREGDYYLQRKPYALLLDHADLLPSKGLVLDVAAGVSPLGLHLAQRGFNVLALDISLHALRLAQARFRAQNQPFDAAAIDLMQAWLPSNHFDVVLDFYFLSRPLLDRLRSALKPGALLFCELLLAEDEQSTRSQHYLLPGELESLFADWENIFSKEARKHGRDPTVDARRIMQFIARRPNESEQTI